jgi:phosphatidylglycerophosphate synthase
MFTKRHGYTLQQVNEKLVMRSWWASYGVLPLANRLVVLVCNYTELTPNQVTTVSSIFRVLSALCFAIGSRWSLVAGALCYYLAYVIDCVDGPVARLKGKTSVFGRYFDHLSDLIGDILILAALAYGQGLLLTPLVLAMLFMHIAESYISYLVNMCLDARGNQGTPSRGSSENGLLNWIWNYRQFFFSRNFKSFLSFPDYEALTLLFFPLIGMPVLGLKVGFILLLVTTLYTIFSSFVSIHTGERRFP